MKPNSNINSNKCKRSYDCILLKNILNALMNIIFLGKTMGRINNIDNGTIEELEEFVPSRQYHLTLLKPVIRLFVAGHSSSTKQESKKGKKV